MSLAESFPAGSSHALAEQLARRRQPEPLHRRTFARIRASTPRLSKERAVKLSWKERDRWVLALKRLAARTWHEAPEGVRRGAWNRAELRWVTMSRIAIDVGEYLADLAARFEGQVFPSYERIAAIVGCSISSAVEAVSQLEQWGWLEHDRRGRLTDEVGPRGQKWEQVSNWYRVRWPQAARRLLERWAKNKAPAADEGQELEEKAQRRPRDEHLVLLDREDLARAPFAVRAWVSGAAFKAAPADDG